MTDNPTLDKIQAELDRLCGKALAKGLLKPEICALFYSHRDQPSLFLKHDGPSKHFHSCKTWVEYIAAADEWLDSLPTPEETRRNRFLERLSEAIEAGRDAGIDDAFVNPLSVMMQQLSENAITDQSGLDPSG